MNAMPPFEPLLLAVTELLDALKCTIEEEHKFARERVRAAAHAVRHAISPRVETPQPPRGGLVAWQQKILRSHIDAHLETKIRNQDLAVLVNLSTCHFGRAFHQSFGMPPHRYLMRARLQRARDLMLNTDHPLSHISAICGLADQAHLTHQFRKTYGESPGAWRRARRAADITPASA